MLGETMAKTKRPCDQCGKIITRPSSAIKAKSVFCDRACYGLWQKENRRGKNHPRWKGGPSKIICTQCQTTFVAQRWRIAQDQKYCGIKCRDKHKSVAMRGENNRNWTGGSKPYPPDFNNALREMVRDRDGRTCQDCGAGESDRRLDVHHKDWNPQNSDPDNLISLCASCHRKVNRI